MTAKNQTISEELFLKETSKHELTILKDDGVYRHLRLRKPDTNDLSFDIITWPGNLCYTGDMGTYVFARLPDMFQFFRNAKQDGPLLINPSYWAEKCEAQDRDGVKRFSAEAFREQVLDYLTDIEVSQELREAIEDQVLSYAEDGEQIAMRAACDFRGREHAEQDFEFSEFFERDCSQFTERYQWCCYALAWAIRKYDAAKSVTVTAIAS